MNGNGKFFEMQNFESSDTGICMFNLIMITIILSEEKIRTSWRTILVVVYSTL